MKKIFNVNILLSLITVLCLFAYATGVKSRLPNIFSSANVTAEIQVVLPNDIPWEANPNIAGLESAIALGNPSNNSCNSELYALFGKMAPGTQFPAHSHPDDRITTVLSGVMYHGVGERFDSEQVQAYPVGSIVYTPAGTPHFMQAKESGTIIQETGFGPTGMTFFPTAP